MTLHVALPSPIDKWPLRDRSAPPAPVRKLTAARMRAKNPEACACTAIAADLRRWRVTGNGARSAMAAAACIADIVKGRRAENLEAPCARGIAAQLGLDVSSLTASRALSLLAAGPLAGFYVAGKPHAPARLLLADLVAAGAAVTPAARVRLPFSIHTASRTTPASSGSEPAAYPKVQTPRNRGTRAVVSKAPPPPKNPDQARELLPAGAHVARTFALVVSAWFASAAWGVGSVADVARSLAPDELWVGQEQLQRAIRSMVRVGVLRSTEIGLECAWQGLRGDAVLAAALMRGEGGVQTLQQVRHAAREAQRLAHEQGQRMLLDAREQERCARAAFDVAQAAHDAARREIAERVLKAELILSGTLEGPDDLAGQVSAEMAEEASMCDGFWGKNGRTHTHILKRIERAMSEATAAALVNATANLRAAGAAVARCFEVPAMPESASEKMLAMLERWGYDARSLTRADAIKLGQRLYFGVVARQQQGLAPLGPRERLASLHAAGVPRERIQVWASGGDAQVQRVVCALRRGVNPDGLWAFFSKDTVRELESSGPTIEDFSEATMLWADLPAANQGVGAEDCPPIDWLAQLDEADWLTVDAGDDMAPARAAGGRW